MLKTLARRPAARTACIGRSRLYVGSAAAQPSSGKKEGDISDAFASLSNTDNRTLPSRYASIKKALISGHEEAITDSFHRLIRHLSTQIPTIRALGSATLPTINFSDLPNPPSSFTKAHKETGVAIIRSVVPASTALSWLDDIKSYVAANPHTKAFPAARPAVYELYWSRAQHLARSHPNVLATSRFLLSHWHSSSCPTAPLSTTHPLTYADRLRIRPPGDTSFSLGPHIDGGSVERWEPRGYGGLSGPYGAIFRGAWEAFDPYDAPARLGVTSDLYAGVGACSAFRMYQGWLALSCTGPGQGTLMVNPLLKAATAYYLLRPFFVARNPDPAGEGFLDGGNWVLEGPQSSNGGGSSKLEGAWPGHGQELSAALHPHLELESTMVSVPEVEPGDYIAWHCDSVHAVDAEHRGAVDASVLYIPACPLTEGNARYLARQREAFLEGAPGPDFPGGVGEREHVGRVGREIFEDQGEVGAEGARALGLRGWDVGEGQTQGEREVLKRANEILEGFMG